ncbi:LrgB family protein [Pseudalkalibacillus berkeleyi]|uniref:LrgB family protein n=1 Tax=Pseudalkalibacillus berkeleyi TaxID=1069813 RepID=A0ABS9H004_9BACL|nr:LrgB family protein [Pseudalkalibacillus berkeleyi]MCF6138332.1 LrgB family protein [Pseudalkalibacillus berkeleyi]
MIELFFVLLTIGLYVLGIQIYKWKKYPFTIPIITATTLIIVFLFLMDFSYSFYMSGAEWIDKLLGPAVVALAYPLYIYRGLIVRYMMPLLVGTFTGVSIGVLSGLILAKWVGAPENVIYSLLPKSVTTPVAMEIAKMTGGMPSIAVVFVMVAGMGGVIMAPYLFKWFNIESEMGRGLGLGAASHAIGTAKSLEYGHQAAAIGSVAMTISALLASILIPIISSWM